MELESASNGVSIRENLGMKSHLPRVRVELGSNGVSICEALAGLSIPDSAGAVVHKNFGNNLFHTL